jgi:sulfur carrier protein ThiS
MATVVLASALARWLPSGSADGELALEVAGATVGQAFDALFCQHPTLRGYVVDELGQLRQHIAVFVDGAALPRRDALSRPLADNAHVHILQALSGG